MKTPTKAIILLTALILLATLCACQTLPELGGANSPKSESQILNDLKESSYFESSLSIDNLNVLKRQTREDDSTDTVYITVDAHSQKYKLVRSLQLNYVLYNEGWILDKISNYPAGENKVTPLVGPDKSLIDDYFNSANAGYRSTPLYESWKIEEETLDSANCEADIYITAKRDCDLSDVTESIVLRYYFDAASCRWCDGVDCRVLEVNSDVDLSKTLGSYYNTGGTWGKDWAELEILQINESNQTIKIECRAYYDYDRKITDYSGTYKYTFTQGANPWDYLIEFPLGKTTNRKIEVSARSIYFDSYTGYTITLYSGY